MSLWRNDAFFDRLQQRLAQEAPGDGLTFSLKVSAEADQSDAYAHFVGQAPTWSADFDFDPNASDAWPARKTTLEATLTDPAGKTVAFAWMDLDTRNGKRSVQTRGSSAEVPGAGRALYKQILDWAGARGAWVRSHDAGTTEPAAKMWRKIYNDPSVSRQRLEREQNPKTDETGENDWAIDDAKHLFYEYRRGSEKTGYGGGAGGGHDIVHTDVLEHDPIDTGRSRITPPVTLPIQPDETLPETLYTDHDAPAQHVGRRFVAAYYHVTFPEHVESILKNGLRASPTGQLGPGVYLTEAPDTIVGPKYKKREVIPLQVAVNVPLLEVDGSGPLDILRAVFGHKEAVRRYEAEPQEHNTSTMRYWFKDGGANWAIMREIVEGAGFGGLSDARGNVGAKNNVVFDPANVQVTDPGALRYVLGGRGWGLEDLGDSEDPNAMGLEPFEDWANADSDDNTGTTNPGEIHLGVLDRSAQVEDEDPEPESALAPASVPAYEYPGRLDPSYVDAFERMKHPALAEVSNKFAICANNNGHLEVQLGRPRGTPIAVVDRVTRTVTLSTSIYAPMTARAFELLGPEYADFQVTSRMDSEGEREELGTVGELQAGAEDLAHDGQVPAPAWSGKDPSKASYKYRVLRRATEQPYYHATRLKHVPKILVEGLRPSASLRSERDGREEGWTQLNGGLQDAVYLTASQGYAYQIAQTLADRYNEPAAIIEVDISGFDPSRLVEDEDETDAAWYEHRGPGYLRSVSNRRIQALGVLGAIPPDRLELVEEVTPEGEDEDGPGIHLGVRKIPPSADVASAAEQVARRTLREEKTIAREDVEITLVRAVGPESWPLFVQQGFAEMLDLPAGRIVLGYLDRPDAVLSWSTEHKRPYVHNLWVSDDMRGKGVARLLYDAFRRHVSPHAVSVGPFSPAGLSAAEALSDEVHDSPPKRWKRKKPEAPPAEVSDIDVDGETTPRKAAIGDLELDDSEDAEPAAPPPAKAPKKAPKTPKTKPSSVAAIVQTVMRGAVPAPWAKVQANLESMDLVLGGGSWFMDGLDLPDMAWFDGYANVARLPDDGWTSDGKVEQYAQLDPEKMPPVVLIHDGQRIQIIDGEHRLRTARTFGLARVRAFLGVEKSGARQAQRDDFGGGGVQVMRHLRPGEHDTLRELYDRAVYRLENLPAEATPNERAYFTQVRDELAVRLETLLDTPPPDPDAPPPPPKRQPKPRGPNPWNDPSQFYESLHPGRPFDPSRDLGPEPEAASPNDVTNLIRPSSVAPRRGDVREVLAGLEDLWGGLGLGDIDLGFEVVAAGSTLEQVIDQLAGRDVALRQQYESAARALMKSGLDMEEIDAELLNQRRERDQFAKSLQATPGARMVGETPNYWIFHITTFEASKALGSRAWCIVRNKKNWNQYTKKQKCTFYFYVNKEKGLPAEYAVAQHPTGLQEVYNQNDQMEPVFEEDAEATYATLTPEGKKRLKEVEALKRKMVKGSPKFVADTLGKSNFSVEELFGGLIRNPNFEECWDRIEMRGEQCARALRRMAHQFPEHVAYAFKLDPREVAAWAKLGAAVKTMEEARDEGITAQEFKPWSAAGLGSIKQIKEATEAEFTPQTFKPWAKLKEWPIRHRGKAAAYEISANFARNWEGGGSDGLMGLIDGGTPRKEIKQWHGIAFPDEWRANGFTPQEAKAWSAVSYSPRGAIEWRDAGYSLEDAAKWVEAGVSRVSDVRDAGLSVEEYAPWRKMFGYLPKDVSEFIMAGFTPETLAPWISTGGGVMPSSARILDLIQKGYTAEEAKLWKELGVSLSVLSTAPSKPEIGPDELLAMIAEAATDAARDDKGRYALGQAVLDGLAREDLGKVFDPKWQRYRNDNESPDMRTIIQLVDHGVAPQRYWADYSKFWHVSTWARPQAIVTYYQKLEEQQKEHDRAEQEALKSGTPSVPGKTDHADLERRFPGYAEFQHDLSRGHLIEPVRALENAFATDNVETIGVLIGALLRAPPATVAQVYGQVRDGIASKIENRILAEVPRGKLSSDYAVALGLEIPTHGPSGRPFPNRPAPQLWPEGFNIVPEGRLLAGVDLAQIGMHQEIWAHLRAAQTWNDILDLQLPHAVLDTLEAAAAYQNGKRSRTAQRQPWAAVDLDGTILEAPDYAAWAPQPNAQPPFGAPKPGAQGALAELVRLGWRVSIYTARFGDESLSEQVVSGWADQIAEYLNAHEIPFSDIWVGRKPRADIFVDDKAIRFEGDWDEILTQLTVIDSRHVPNETDETDVPQAAPATAPGEAQVGDIELEAGGPFPDEANPNNFDDPLGDRAPRGVSRDVLKGYAA